MKTYKVFINIALISALVFLSVSIILWVMLVIYSFVNTGFIVDTNNFDIVYRIALISTTITFGLFTIQFTLRSLQNALSDKRSKELIRTNELLKEFMELASSPKFLFVKAVCRELSDIFNFGTSFDNFENTQKDFVNILLSLLANSSKSFSSELINASKAYIHRSTIDNDSPEWFKSKYTNDKMYEYFMSSYVAIENRFEVFSYQYINKSVDDNLFEEQLLNDIRFFYLFHLLFVGLGMVTNDCKSISYQAIRIFKEKNDKIKK